MATEGGDSVIQVPISAVIIDPEEQRFRRLLPRYLPLTSNHIYVNMNTNFKNQFVRGKSLLSTERDFIIVHGLGTGIEKAINLALEIKNSLPKVNITSHTSGFHVNEELALMLDGDRQTRSVPVIHMKLFKPSKQDDDKCNLEAKGQHGN